MLRITFSHAALCAALLYSACAVSGEKPTDLDKDPNRIEGSMGVKAAYVDSIDTYNGNLRIHQADLTLPGNGLPIEVYRNYDMRSTSSGLRGPNMLSHAWTALGLGWQLDTAPTLSVVNDLHSISSQFDTDPLWIYERTPFDYVCENKGASPVPWAKPIQLRLPNGSNEELYYSGNYTASSASNWRLQCLNDNITVNAPNGTTYDFGNYRTKRNIGVFRTAIPMTVGGKALERTETYLNALKATDNNGNWLTYTYAFRGLRYAPWNNPKTSSFPDYGDFSMDPMLEGSTNLLRKIESSDGRTVTLTYNEANGRLQSLSDNTGRVVKYGYSEKSKTLNTFLTSVTLPTGDTWRYDYQPGAYSMTYPSYTINPLNNTTVANRKLIALHYPSGGKITYGYTFVNQSTTLYENSGSSSSSQGVWLSEERIASRTLSSGGAWKYTYVRGGIGQLDQTTVTGPEGTRTLKYFGLGHAIITHTTYPVSTFGNLGWKAGSLIEERTPNGNITTYDWQPRKIANGQRSRFELGAIYDKQIWAPLLMARTVTRDGATYTSKFSGHDAYGNPTTIVETGPNGSSLTTKLNYLNDASRWMIGKIKSETSQAGSRTRTFDAKGNVLSETRNGVTTSFTYDAQGNLASKTLPGNRVHTYSNYKRGIPQTEVQPEGIKLTRVVDNAGNITSETNGEGKTTRYTYDGLGRVTGKTPPSGNAQIITYTPKSKTAKRGTLVETTQLDPFGRVASITVAGITTRYEYDGLGRRTFVSDPGATTGTRYQYDALGRVTRITNADTSYQAIAYGAATRTITDERRKATIETYRGYGNPDQLQLMAITAPEPSANVTLTRDGADRITSVKQGAFTRTYTYYGNGYLSSVTNPETGKTVYGRDVAGNMTTKQVGASGVTRYTYDGQNRLKSVTYPGTTPAVTNTYDKTSKLLTSTSTGGNRAMAYDPVGNLIQQSLSLDGKTFTAKYAYNANDHLASITYPQSGRVVNYNPDLVGRPTTVSGYVTKVTYWPSGMINQITYANGTTSTYSQNARLWPATFTTAKTGGTNYLNSAYTYDGTGNLATIRDTVDSSFNRTLGYDAINRLTNAAGFWGAGTISYDGVGNLLKQTYGTTSLNYTYDAQNRLASVSGQRAGSFRYDAYGNIASSAGTTYTYDGVPNLVCINCAVAASKVAYQYDAINQRSSVTKAGRKVYEMHDTDGKQLIELDGNTLTEYIYLGDKRIADRVSP
jgi:YD repeat-containing protein